MRINGYRCDGCGKEHSIGRPDPYRDRESEAFKALPPDWYLVSRGDRYHKGEDPWTFCSKKCLREHPFVPEDGKEQAQ